MSTKVLFLPVDSRQVMRERGIPLLETTDVNDLGARRSAGRGPRRRKSPLLNLQAAFLLGEEAGVERIRAAALGRLEHQASVGTQSVALTEAQLAGAASEEETGVRLLESVGGAIVDEMTDAEADRLRAAGFEVHENVLAYFAPPLLPGQQAAADVWHLENCGAVAMHGRGYTGRGLRIGILDTGIDAAHPEFAGKDIRFAEFDMMGRVVGTVPRDTGDHGTHVAGIAAGLHTGVASEADLAVAAVLTYPGPNGNSGYLAQISRGLDWLSGTDVDGVPAPEDVAVVNGSFGASGYNNYLYNPMATARAIGISYVGSIGNSGRGGIDRHGSPGNYDIAIGVGASDAGDGVGDFSDWGTVAQHGGLAKPDLCAPGVDVRSSLPGGGYGYKDGTSMAAPCVAGAVALLIQEDPSLADDVAALERLLYGRIASMTGARRERSGRGRLSL
ncbi:MAG: S8 family serine peptidase [Alphaproteobacteria bacterium]|nr:S8 family serine peptidase [Alphaproteobacteria bacterium]